MYKYEYNNSCYQKCPNGTYQLEGDADNKCYKQISEGYCLDLTNNTFRKCYETCRICNQSGNESYNNCEECKANYSFYKTLNNINCYKKCNYNYYFDESNQYYCVENCPEKFNKSIIGKNKCIDDCKKEDIYKYEFNNSCYQKCPNDTYLIEDKNDFVCYDKNPDGYYLDLEKSVYKNCYETCDKCKIEGNELNNNCEICKKNYTFYQNLMNVSNCYKTCNFYYYFNESNNFRCTNLFKCPKEYNKLIKNKNQCVDDCKNTDVYRYEYNNTCYQECPNGTIHNDNDYICFNYQNMETTNTIDINPNLSSTIDILSTYLEREEMDREIENFRELISNFSITENKEDIISKKDNVQFQMTTSDNQKKNSNKNVSTIDLGDCETKLKNIYGINQSLPLIIFKIDYFSPDSLIPIIGYEIYHPITKIKLNLTYCEDILIKLNIPVSIDETKLFKYDPNSGFYTDNCFPYTTENGTDIIISDRKQEF